MLRCRSLLAAVPRGRPCPRVGHPQAAVGRPPRVSLPVAAPAVPSRLLGAGSPQTLPSRLAALPAPAAPQAAQGRPEPVPSGPGRLGASSHAELPGSDPAGHGRPGAAAVCEGLPGLAMVNRGAAREDIRLPVHKRKQEEARCRF